MIGSAKGRLRPRGAVLAASALAVLGVSACTGSAASPADTDEQRDGSGTTVVEDSVAPVSFDSNVERRDVSVDTVVTVSADDGRLEDVTLSYGRGVDRTRVSGSMRDAGTTWTAGDRLEPGQTYQLTLRGSDAEGGSTWKRTSFRTQDLTLDDQTYPSIAPLDGSTVGVGMPVVVTFDIPVTDRAEAERHLRVTSSPQVRGSWSWLSDTEVHFRPQGYWPAGTEVTVDADLNGVAVGDGIYGQESRSIDFSVGSSVISEIDVAAHTMQVWIDGELARTLPITSGKPGYETRDGTKVIMEKYDSKTMDAATTGVSPGDPEYYDIDDVQYAMRVTYSGEFIHAAPWSTGSQGADNVSHGCVGLSTDDALWLYEQSQVGDIVEVTGSGRGLEDGNGWTDWNESFAQYRQGSAL